jgi:predicted DNA-binding transcriptional regulator AlpA
MTPFTEPHPDHATEQLELLRQIRDLLAREQAELVDRVGLSRLTTLSLRKIDELSATPGALPTPIRIGSRVLWRKRDVVKWIEGGCQRKRT